MASRRLFAPNLVLALTAALVTGCATVSTDVSRQADAVPQSRAPEPRIDEASVTAEEPDAIDRVLAERRRGDYPQIESDATGFTITEQSRISGDAHTQYDRALGLLEQERYAEAIAELTGLTEVVPEVTAPYIDLGIAYRQIGDLEQAAAALETAARLSPEHPIVRNELGIVYRQAGRFADARAQYEAALAVFADYHYARRNLGVLCDLFLADVECALQNYRMYLESVGEDPEVEIWIADLTTRTSQNR